MVSPEPYSSLILPVREEDKRLVIDDSYNFRIGFEVEELSLAALEKGHLLGSSDLCVGSVWVKLLVLSDEGTEMSSPEYAYVSISFDQESDSFITEVANFPTLENGEQELCPGFKNIEIGGTIELEGYDAPSEPPIVVAITVAANTDLHPAELIGNLSPPSDQVSIEFESAICDLNPIKGLVQTALMRAELAASEEDRESLTNELFRLRAGLAHAGQALEADECAESIEIAWRLTETHMLMQDIGFLRDEGRDRLLRRARGELAADSPNEYEIEKIALALARAGLEESLEVFDGMVELQQLRAGVLHRSHLNMAFVAARHGRQEQAVENFCRARELENRDSAALFKETAHAVAVWASIPGSEPAESERAAVQALVDGKTDIAREEYGKLLQQDPIQLGALLRAAQTELLEAFSYIRITDWIRDEGPTVQFIDCIGATTDAKLYALPFGRPSPVADEIYDIFEKRDPVDKDNVLRICQRKASRSLQFANDLLKRTPEDHPLACIISDDIKLGLKWLRSEV